MSHLPSITTCFLPGRSCQGHCDDGMVCEDHPDTPAFHGYDDDSCGGAAVLAARRRGR